MNYNYTCISFGVLFISFGLIFFLGLVHSRTDAWKAMTAAERASVKIGPLCRNIGSMIILCGAIFMVSGLSPAFKESGFVWAMIAWMILSCLDIYFINKSARYKVQPVKQQANNRQ